MGCRWRLSQLWQRRQVQGWRGGHFCHPRGGVQYSSTHGLVTSSAGSAARSKLKVAMPTASARAALGEAHTSRSSLRSSASVVAPALRSSPTYSTPKAQWAVALWLKPTPVTVTLVPPAALPLAGEIALTTGGA